MENEGFNVITCWNLVRDNGDGSSIFIECQCVRHVLVVSLDDFTKCLGLLSFRRIDLGDNCERRWSNTDLIVRKERKYCCSLIRPAIMNYKLPVSVQFKRNIFLFKFLDRVSVWKTVLINWSKWMKYFWQKPDLILLIQLHVQPMSNVFLNVISIVRRIDQEW